MIKMPVSDTPQVDMTRGYNQTEPARGNAAADATLLAVANEYVSAQWMGATLPDDVDDEGLEKELCKSRARAVLFRQPPMPPRIGRFTLIKRIGAGGMGEVFVAYDEQLGRSVAIKLVRPEYSRKMGANQRLLREARSLARLSHQNVVQIYDVGIHESRVFIAMELIRGRTLREWLDQKLGGALVGEGRWRDILGTHLAAGRGLAAAHAEGLIHRDFKPENVLIGTSGRVCVVDFGLAGKAYQTDTEERDIRAQTTVGADISASDGDEKRAGDATVSERKRLTAVGAIMGTPAYMSPEQMTGKPTDARTDQFSFCVALFEALYGAHPFGPDAKRSVRLQRMAEGDIVSPSERGVPAWLLRVLRRGLQAAPGDRHGSMDELLEALRGPKAPRRRNWFGAVAGVMLMAVFFLAGRSGERPSPCASAGDSLTQVWNQGAATQLRSAFMATGVPYASETFERVRSGLEAYTERLRTAQLDICQATYVRREQPEKLYVVRSLCLEHRERYVQSLVNSLRTADARAIEKSVEALAGLPSVAACENSENLVLGVRPPATGIADEVAAVRSLLSEADVSYLLGDFQRASELSHEGLDRAKRLDYEPVLAEAFHQSARSALSEASEASLASAERQMFTALDLAESLRHDDLAANIWSDLVLLQLRRGRDLDLGHRWARRALAASERILDDQRKAYVLGAVGRLYYRADDLVQAEAFHRQSLELARKSGMPAIHIGGILHDFANVLARANQVDQARASFAEARAILTAELSASHPEVGVLFHDLASFLQNVGALEEARALYAETIAIWTSEYGPMHRQVGSAHLALATLEVSRGALKQAEEQAALAQKIFAGIESRDANLLATSQSVRGDIALARGLADEAMMLYGQALSTYRDAFGEQNLFAAIMLTNLSRALSDLGRYDDALRKADIAARIMSRFDSMLPAFRALPHNRRGLALLGQGKASEALIELETAQRLLADEQAYPEVRAEAAWALTRALAATGRGSVEQIREQAEKAIEIYDQIGPAGQAERREIIKWLASQEDASTKQ